ncbi:MAG: hypothetical protein H0U98_09690 [Alphaproteobacteria bacterium]|nr:hypothetical protein [Alphaproteobacteria bacterium]
MQGISRGLRHLAIIALLVRAMLPAGWMPDAQGLVLCSVSLSPVIHHDGGQKHNDQSQATHQDCAFAAAAQLAAAPDAPHIALPAFHAFAARSDDARAAVIASRFSPVSPRAPPLTV